MDLTKEQIQTMTEGKMLFSNAMINFLMVHSSLMIYATNLNLADIAKESEELKIQIKSIDEISKEIAQISAKTQMLSINASIEAARAGSAGKGFAVVAKEVGELSKQTKMSTTRVNEVNKRTYKEAEDTEMEIRKVQSELDKFDESNATLSKEISQRIKIEEKEYIVSLLAKRLENHADFLRNVLNNAGKLETVVDHHNCAFGKWYDANKSKYSDMREYTQMESIHAQFHLLAREFNETMEVSTILKLVDVSHKILFCFLELVDAFETRAVKNPERYL